MIIYGSTTAQVYEQDGLVYKRHPAVVGEKHGAMLASLTALLHRDGVSVPNLLSQGMDSDQLVTVWDHVGNGSVDWHAAGTLVRRVHSLPIDAYVKLDLPLINCRTYYDEELAQDWVRQDPELARLLSLWVNRTFGRLSLSDLKPVVLVHDDLWPKNFLGGPTGATLLDWDNVALSTAAHDLSFMTRARHRGDLTLEDFAAFQEGYGSPCPPLHQAQTWALLHRARWVCSLLHRASLGEPKAQALLAEERPKWNENKSPVE